MLCNSLLLQAYYLLASYN